jgi:hypothetical protein
MHDQVLVLPSIIFPFKSFTTHSAATQLLSFQGCLLLMLQPCSFGFSSFIPGV